MLTAPPSLWTSTLTQEERFEIFPPATNPDVDVAVVGGGFSGLWTAWALQQSDPTLRIAVIERNGVGFGASGRNGGWASALSAVSLSELSRLHGPDNARRLQRTLIEMVADLHQVILDHDLEPGAAFGGTVELIRSPRQAERARHHLGEWRSFGFGDEDYRWMSSAETAELVRATRVQGSLFTPHCLAIQPARLAHRLAALLESRGVSIVQGSVERITPGRVECSGWHAKATTIVNATEAYLVQQPHHRRDVIPIYSMMVATEPLDDHLWSEIGLDHRPTFADFRQNIIYGQRTSDGRFAFGGRGAPYHFASRISSEFDTDQRIRDRLVTTLHQLFPLLESSTIDFHWGGPLALPRDLHAYVNLDRSTGIGRLGGYVGDGVTSTFLAGRTMADLILGRATELIDLPWVNHRSRRWEFEPLRWLGVNSGRSLARFSDQLDERRLPGVSVADRAMSILLRR
jgi:glycine/D-amino acid oxidase-like deaminating enzyme